MKHIEYLRKANEVARRSCAGGNTPFGAILVDEDGQVLMEQGNAEHELHDATAHAERVLASRASAAFDKKRLWGCTLYTTCEPCPMCTGAIYWANIGKIAFGISETKLLELTGGIVQGMSGSPILQNGRLVGAVTHVLVNDAAKGYGILAENMLKQATGVEK